MATVRGKRMSAKVQESVERMLNGASEPKFTALNSDKLSMMHGLNHYNIHVKKEMSKRWVMEWVKKNAPELVNGLKDKKDFRFENLGFVFRMAQNGFVLDAEQIAKIKRKLVALSVFVEPEVVEERKVVPKKVAPINKTLEDFDYAVDDVLMGVDPRAVALSTDKKHNLEVVAKCDKSLAEMEEAPEYFAKESIRKMKKFLNKVKKEVEAISQIVKQQKVRKVAPKKINPAKMVSKLQYKKKDIELGLESVRPETLIGAKQAIIYNTEYRFLMYFKSATDDGFMVTGSTLKNYDVEKSVFKKIRKPEEMAAVIKGQTIATIRKYLDKITSKEFACKGRFNENSIIVKV
jgi:hypothetical protein